MNQAPARAQRQPDQTAKLAQERPPPGGAIGGRPQHRPLGGERPPEPFSGAPFWAACVGGDRKQPQPGAPDRQRGPVPTCSGDQSQRFKNFMKAVERGKGQVEGEFGNRVKRNEVFEECASGCDAEAKIQDLEQRALLAKMKSWSTNDFEAIRTLGQGSYGKVLLVRQKGCDGLYALKQMKKEGYTKKNNVDRAFCEREVLSQAKSKWFVELTATFQDVDNVYMVMEFVQGGDLFYHMANKTRFSVAETQFYMAELLEALDVVHRCGFVHRDVKPDNMVLTARGHLKLLDFGLAKSRVDGEAVWDPRSKPPEWETASPASAVDRNALANGSTRTRDNLASKTGTPPYMAPEHFEGRFGAACDLWSLGVITFECLYGSTPWNVDTRDRDWLRKLARAVKDFQRIMDIKLSRGKERGHITPEAEHLLRGIICEHGNRLTADGIRAEPFFQGVDFTSLHTMEPPIRPELELSGPDDCRYFGSREGGAELPPPSHGSRKDGDMYWTHYEFDRSELDLQRPEAVRELFCPATAC